ncbi:MAG: methylated-DNA--[protein]-cysteine S-methyltransferase [Nitrospirae bacterium]|nr:MAG: methylated-DNA--[protein]-cysteine S-methyltransferase [Nitrospirota bacterium]
MTRFPINPSRQEPVYYSEIDSPVGRLLLAGTAQGLTHLVFQDGAHPLVPPPHWFRDSQPLEPAIRQVQAYFAGQCLRFTIALAPGGTPFQRRVWQALQTIPYGHTISYGALARMIGQPHAARAVGAANACNPISIIIPCHRVIGSTGKLVGYGGGLAIKEALLALERQFAGPNDAASSRPEVTGDHDAS